MKKMIKNVFIKKFRKLENVNEELSLINEIYGSNGCGKTSFISFITWLIYGETLDYGKNDDLNIDSFQPYKLISGEIECDNGYTFGREYGYNENGKKTNDFYVNGRKTKNQNEYYNAIYNCFNVKNVDFKIKDLNILRALSDPYYLPHNETQFRNLIENLLNVDTYSILFENEKYQDIKKDYDRQSCDYDNTKDFYKQQLKNIEKDLETTNLRIGELKSIKFDKEEYDGLVNELKALTNDDIDEQNKEIKGLTDELNNVYLELINSRKKDLVDKPLTDDEKALNEIKQKYNDLLIEYNAQVKANEYNADLRNLANEKKTSFENELKKIKESKFVEIHCPNCDTLVNEDDYKKFNKNKVDSLKKIKEKIAITEKELKSYVDFNVDEMANQLSEYSNEIVRLKTLINTNPNIYVSDETKAIESTYNELYDNIKLLKENKQTNEEKKFEKISELQQKINELNNNYNASRDLEIYKKNKETLLSNKSVYELRLAKLEEYRLDEIKIIKEKTKEIFGDGFEFEMLVKNKINDNYKKVCYASIDGLEHNKSNTAKYLKYSIMLLEKLKQYIGGCDLPIIFDIIDNIGESAKNDILKEIKTQILYTKISYKDDVERTVVSLPF